MARHRWPAAAPPDELGAVAHGPVVLGRDAGVVVGLRCVFAHPSGLHLPLVTIAVGVHAEAAMRQTETLRPRPGRVSDPPGWSWLELHGEVNGRTGELLPFETTSSASVDRYVQESAYWLGELPADGVLRLTVAWPRVGLREVETAVALDRLPEAAARAIPLS